MNKQAKPFHWNRIRPGEYSLLGTDPPYKVIIKREGYGWFIYLSDHGDLQDTDTNWRVAQAFLTLKSAKAYLELPGSFGPFSVPHLTPFTR